MNTRLLKKLSGMGKEFNNVTALFNTLVPHATDPGALKSAVTETMKRLSYDSVRCDEVGNIIGSINGYGKNGDIAIISRINATIDREGGNAIWAGAITSIFTGTLLKRAIAPLTGDLLICLYPDNGYSDFNIRYLIEHTLKNRTIKGVILAEPTGYSVNIGNKGKMEYEIVLRDIPSMDHREKGAGAPAYSVYPVVRRLNSFSRSLPHDRDLGDSALMVKDISFAPGAAHGNECRITVDRLFVPDENSAEIVARARTIACEAYAARDAYAGASLPDISAAVAQRNITGPDGREWTLSKHSKPWKMESHHPFATASLQSLDDAGFNSSLGYWKKIVTAGSCTFGDFGIPTIGFGAGFEDELPVLGANFMHNEIERSVYGKALIVYRSIGFPTFGWCDDEI